MKISPAGSPVYLIYKECKCEKGESRFFGAPDLPEDFDWPQDGEGYDLEFICQIDCAAAHRYNDLLPETGHLWFFGNIANALGEEEAPAALPGFQAPTEFRVYYDDTDTELLLVGEIVDEDGDPAGFRELKIEFSTDIDDCREALHQLGGEPPENDYPDDFKNLRLLFCLDSFRGADFTLEFEHSAYMYFLVDEAAFGNREFNKAVAYLAV